MAQSRRDISSDEALRRLTMLYNELGVIGGLITPQRSDEYRDALLHCIAALHCVREEPVPIGETATVLEFTRPR